jgi:hypothetical protein
MEKYTVIDKLSSMVVTTMDDLSAIAQFANEDTHAVALTANVKLVPVELPNSSFAGMISMSMQTQRKVSNLDSIDTIPFYQLKRVVAYPPLAEQLDTIYHNGIDVWREQIAATKAAYPKQH